MRRIPPPGCACALDDPGASTAAMPASGRAANERADEFSSSHICPQKDHGGTVAA
jgi:hypothetical protein